MSACVNAFRREKLTTMCEYMCMNRCVRERCPAICVGAATDNLGLYACAHARIKNLLDSSAHARHLLAAACK